MICLTCDWLCAHIVLIIIVSIVNTIGRKEERGGCHFKVATLLTSKQQQQQHLELHILLLVVQFTFCKFKQNPNA